MAVPLGLGDTVEGQVTGRESAEAIRLLVFEPRPGIFPDEAPPLPCGPVAVCAPSPSGAMRLGAGGTIRQKLYPDPHGVETWDPEHRGEIAVHILDSRLFQELTGRIPPPSPVNALTYAEYGLPWFDLYDEDRADLDATDTLAGILPVRRRDEARGEEPDERDRPIPVEESSVWRLHPPSSHLSHPDGSGPSRPGPS